MSFKIVVARYNESIDWLNDITDHCIIYNKGVPLNLTNEITLENVGRESHTYLYYIINNYENLPDIVVFTQGNISDHRPPGKSEYLLKLKTEAQEYGKSKPYGVYSSYGNQSTCWDPEFNKKGDEFMMSDNYKNKHLTFIEWYIKHVSPFYPNPINLYCSGLFAVKKELILLNTKEYYQSLLEECNHHVNPIEGHFFERSWYYIFSNRNAPP